MILSIVIISVGIPTVITLRKIEQHIKKIEKNTAYLVSKVKKAEKLANDINNSLQFNN